MSHTPISVAYTDTPVASPLALANQSLLAVRQCEKSAQTLKNSGILWMQRDTYVAAIRTVWTPLPRGRSFIYKSPALQVYIYLITCIIFDTCTPHSRKLPCRESVRSLRSHSARTRTQIIIVRVWYYRCGSTFRSSLVSTFGPLSTCLVFIEHINPVIMNATALSPVPEIWHQSHSPHRPHELT